MLGIDDECDEGQEKAQYAVDVGSEGYALVREELEGTGEFVDRDAFYEDDRLLVEAELYLPEDDEVPRDD